MFMNLFRTVLLVGLIFCPTVHAFAESLNASCRSEDDGQASTTLLSKIRSDGTLIFEGEVGTIQNGAVPVRLYLNIRRERVAGLRRFVIHTLNVSAKGSGADVAVAQISDYIPALQRAKHARFNLTLGGLGILDPEGLNCDFELNGPSVKLK